MFLVGSSCGPGGSTKGARAWGFNKELASGYGFLDAVYAADVYGGARTDPDHARNVGFKAAPTGDGGDSDLPMQPRGSLLARCDAAPRHLFASGATGVGG